MKTNILIVGGGLGGCSAALAAAHLGEEVVLLEETDWLGGQLTSQAVPPDEHGWIEDFGCTQSYRRLRTQIRNFYKAYYPLTEEARSNSRLNPGNGWVSPLCHEPKVALSVLESMLSPFVSARRLTILLKHRLLLADCPEGNRVKSVVVQNLESGREMLVEADYFIDASELGELLPATGTESVTGRESQAETGEPGAASSPEPDNNQAFSYCFAVDHLEGEDHTIDPPDEYSFWRDFVPDLDPAWPGKLFSWETLHPRTMETISYQFNPNQEESKAFAGLWSFRRILNRTILDPGLFQSDICLVNWPMIDYMLGDILNCSEQERLKHLKRAKQQSLSLLHWLQTEAPRPDGGAGWPGLRLRKDIVGTDDGLAKYPYVREARRIQAAFTVLEQHVSKACRPGRSTAQRFRDSVGIGYYRIDLHPTSGGDNYYDVASLPFQIPLGALIPIRMENLIPASKNIGTTHITNGCFRLHPVEWNIGEAAGSLAAFCRRRGNTPRQVRENQTALTEFQDLLIRQGIELEWPENLVLDDGDPHAHAR